MVQATKESIVSFLLHKGWTQGERGKYNVGYIPPAELDLPSSYRLEIPIDAEGKSFDIYSQQVINLLMDIYSYSNQELGILFYSPNSVLSMRVIDNDTKDGTINLERFTAILEHLKYIIRDAATFSITESQIFQKTPQESKDYLKLCRGLQTSVGSFITKIQLPSEQYISDALTRINTSNVVNKIGICTDFINNEASNTPLNHIDEVFINEHRSVINIELLSQIKNLHQSSKTNTAEITINSRDYTFEVNMNDMMKKMSHINNFIKKTRQVLLRQTPLEISGRITKLVSKDVFGRIHQIEVEAEVEGRKQNVKLNLVKEIYTQAIEAHKENRIVRASGLAVNSGGGYSIDNVFNFNVI